MFKIQMFKNLSAIFSLVIIAVVGDYSYPLFKIPIERAVCDNFIHAVIGGISWLLITINIKSSNQYAFQEKLYEIGLCTMISSLIDLDHFIAARSFSLKDVTQLKRRPPLHCSTFPLATSLALLLVGYVLQIQWLLKLALIILIAFTSHHIRDATRRGLWFYPFGSTPPIPYFLYLIITVIFPYIALIMITNLNVDQSSYHTEPDVLVKILIS